MPAIEQLHVVAADGGNAVPVQEDMGHAVDVSLH